MMSIRRRHWMVCDLLGSSHKNDTPCLFDEEAALRRGDPPRCIRHGALLFSDSSLDGLSRDRAREHIRKKWEIDR